MALLETFQSSHLRSATDIYWVEAKGAARFPTMHRTVPTAKTYLVQNVRGAEAEKS